MKLFTATILVLSLFASFNIASAASRVDQSIEHGGGTDKLGCHVDRKTGIRHCH